MYTVAWEDQRRELTSCDELDNLLKALERQYAGENAIFVTITRAQTGDTLKVAVGRDRTVLDYVPGSLEPPYYASVGDPEEGGSLVFRFEGEATEVPAKNAIPWELGQ